MDSEDDIRTILARTAEGAGGPPMRLEAADVIDRGGRIRRRRKRLAVAGSSAATAVVLAVAGFAAGHRAGPDPVQPAGPGLSTIGTTAPPSPTASTPEPVPSQAPTGATGRDPGRVITPPAATTRKSTRTTPPSAAVPTTQRAPSMAPTPTN